MRASTMFHALALAAVAGIAGAQAAAPIDREALVRRHNPQLTSIDPATAFMVGNGNIAFTADISWNGKSHLEMHLWHAAHFAVWGRTEQLERSSQGWNLEGTQRGTASSALTQGAMTHGE